MEVIARLEDFKTISSNEVIGVANVFNDSKIIFKGHGNILYIAPGVNFINCNIVFNGNDSLVYISEAKCNYIINATIFNSSVLYFGPDSYFNKNINVICSEHKNIIIGGGCLFSYGITIRNADAHLIFDLNSNERINFSKSIYIGDGVWLSQDCMILKGSIIGSGSIIGAASIVSNKVIPSHSIWAGNPAKEVKRNVSWEGSCVHPWLPNDTEKNKMSKVSFRYTATDAIDLSFIESSLTSLASPLEKLDFLKNSFILKKNRMFIE